MSWLQIGTAIVGRYVLLGPIGYGGVSVVYHAIDAERGQPAAVKLLSEAFDGDSFARAKVHHEALITKRLRHPSVPRIYSYGDATLADGRVVPYVAMELLTGSVLADRLADGPLPWREAVAVAATIADVLAIAHRRGVVHRDLTPVNIMITSSGVKIIDFGEATTIEAASPLAKAIPLPARRVTGAGTPADDVYALGVLLYQMLTGRSPYHNGDSTGSEFGADVAAARMRRVAPTPVLTVPGLPREAAELCRSCMAKRAEDRPDSARIALALWSLVMPEGGDGAPAGDSDEIGVPSFLVSEIRPPTAVLPPDTGFATDGRDTGYNAGGWGSATGERGSATSERASGGGGRNAAPARAPLSGRRVGGEQDFTWWQRPAPGSGRDSGPAYAAAGRSVPYSSESD